MVSSSDPFDDDEGEICKEEVENDLSKYSRSDKILLLRSMRTIYGTFRDFLDEHERAASEAAKTEAVDKYKERFRLQYKFYRCTVQKKIQSNNKTASTLKTVFGILLYIIMCIPTAYAMKEIYNIATMNNRNPGYVPRIKLSTALITIFIVNPIMSVVKTIIDMISFNVSQKVSISEDLGELKTCMRNAWSAISCPNAVAEFLTEAQKYVKIYEEKFMDDLPSKRMTKLGELNQFVENLRTFVYRSENPQLSDMNQEKILMCYSFMKGGRMRMLDSMLSTETSSVSDEDARMYFKRSSTVRTKAGEILAYYDSGFDSDAVTSYDSYFIEAINTSMRALVLFAIKHAKSSTHGFASQMEVRFCSDTSDVLAGADHSTDIVTHFSLVCDRIRKLKKLMLPESQYMMTFLNPNALPEWNDLIDNFNSARDSAQDVLMVIELLLNNTEYLYRTPSEETCVLTTQEVRRTVNAGTVNEAVHSIRVPKLECDTEDGADVCLTYQEEFDVREVFIKLGTSAWREGDTLLYARTTAFISAFQVTELPSTFRTDYKIECDLIDDVLDNEMQFEWTVDIVMRAFENEDASESVSNETFIANARKYLSRLHATINNPGAKSLIYDKDNTIDNPLLFITFDQFSAKLDMMASDKIGAFQTMVDKNAENVTFFTDRMEELNDSTERKLYMSSEYMRLLVFYGIISFIWVTDYSLNYYKKKSFEELMLERKQRIAMKKKEKEAEKAKEDGEAAAKPSSSIKDRMSATLSKLRPSS